MEPLDWILVAVRWGHALGAVAWVGGGIFYLLVLRPAFQRAPAGDAPHRAIASEFRGLVNTAIALLIITGIVLSAARLTSDAVSTAYVVVLALKVALALYMFGMVWFLHRRASPETGSGGWWPRARRELTGTTAVLVAGVIVIGLADVLSALFEAGLEQ